MSTPRSLASLRTGGLARVRTSPLEAAGASAAGVCAGTAGSSASTTSGVSISPGVNDAWSWSCVDRSAAAAAGDIALRGRRIASRSTLLRPTRLSPSPPPLAAGLLVDLGRSGGLGRLDRRRALLPDRPDWTAVITGRVTPEHRAFADGLKRGIAAAGLEKRILFLGEVADIKVWYRRVSLYVAPSRNEGFGLTPLEAMASGAAVVASDAGAYAELVDDGVTGAIVPAGDGAALTQAIRRYLDDPELAKRHGAEGLVEARACFPLEREAAGIETVYDDVWARGE